MSDNKITRRDFLNGVAIATAGTLMPSKLLAMPPIQTPGDYYPPKLTGIRGNHEGSFEISHQLAWKGIKPRIDQENTVEEHYDLVVVGAGISGLSAAHFYRKYHGRDKKVLILDNHDDFGGHAKRNEFIANGRKVLAPGGSFVLADPNSYSETSKALLEELGIDIQKLTSSLAPNYPFANLGGNLGFHFNKSAYSQNTIVTGEWLKEWNKGGPEIFELLEQSPLSEEELHALRPFLRGDKDYLGEKFAWEKIAYLEKTSYLDFLSKDVGLSKRVIDLFSVLATINYGHDASCLPALEGLLHGPGLKSLGWLGKLGSKIVSDRIENLQIAAFPDGNAGLARALVYRLIPSVVDTSVSAEALTGAQFDYQQLDKVSSHARIRLNSSVFNVKNMGDGSVLTSYSRLGKTQQVVSKHVILACYNGLIPHICPEISEEQKYNLQYGVKTPLVYSNVLVNNSKAFYKGGADMYFCPSSPYTAVVKELPVSLDGYSPPKPEESTMVLHMQQVPSPSRSGQMSARDLYRLGRHILYTKSFEQYETEIKNQLAEMFGQYGFDPDRDIQAITINRWSHGYAYEYNSLFDPDFEDGQEPHVLGRKPIGNITIANSDSEAKPFLDGAIDAALRAVQELPT